MKTSYQIKEKKPWFNKIKEFIEVTPIIKTISLHDNF